MDDRLHASLVGHGRLSLTQNPAVVVDRRGDRVGPSESRELAHYAVLPDEWNASESGAESAEVLLVGVSSFRASCYDARIVQTDGGAVRATERNQTEIGRLSVLPEHRVLPAIGCIGQARNQSVVGVALDRLTERSARKRAEVSDGVAGGVAIDCERMDNAVERIAADDFPTELIASTPVAVAPGKSIVVNLPPLKT